MPVDRRIETRKENGAGKDDDVVGGQQKQSPEEGIPEGGPIPLHRDTTIKATAGKDSDFRRDCQYQYQSYNV